MAHNRTPPVKILLESEIYNVLMFTLNSWIEFKTDGGNTFGTIARELRNKIEKYVRLFTNKDGYEMACVHFFEEEAAVLIELLLLSLYPYSDSDSGYYDNLLKLRKPTEVKKTSR